MNSNTQYRMWYQRFNTVAVGGNSAEQAAQWKPTDHLFRGRTQAEAQRKAERFWADAQLGAGSVLCVPLGQSIEEAIND